MQQFLIRAFAFRTAGWWYPAATLLCTLFFWPYNAIFCNLLLLYSKEIWLSDYNKCYVPAEKSLRVTVYLIFHKSQRAPTEIRKTLNGEKINEQNFQNITFKVFFIVVYPQSKILWQILKNMDKKWKHDGNKWLYKLRKGWTDSGLFVLQPESHLWIHLDLWR